MARGPHGAGARARAGGCGRACCARLFSSAGLCALVCAYALLGALLFRRLEAAHELRERARLRRLRLSCVRDLLRLAGCAATGGGGLRRLSARLRQHEGAAAAAGGGPGPPRWTLAGALLYCVTLITTIGYGTLAPRTPAGRLLTILYALPGVPLLLLCLSSLGAPLAAASRFAYCRLRGCCRRLRPGPGPGPDPGLDPGPAAPTPTPTPSPPPTPPLPPDARALLDECYLYMAAETKHARNNAEAGAGVAAAAGAGAGTEVASEAGAEAEAGQPEPVEAEEAAPETEVPRVPPVAVLLLLTAYIGLGAAVFAAWEGWSLLDGAYFCFITLSTIGLGDLVPGKSLARAGSRGGELQLLACCAYLLLGLTLLAAAFRLLQREAAASLRRLAARLAP